MRRFNKKRFSTWHVVIMLTIAFVGIIGIGHAVTVPNTFISDTTISSSQVNQNFSVLGDAIDQNKSVIACSTESNLISSLSTDVSNNKNVTISVPGPGTILVTASGMFRISDTYDGSSFQASVSVVDTSLGYDISASNYWGPFRGGLPAGVSYDVPFHEHRNFTVTAAGDYTYYLTAKLLVAPTAGTVLAGKSRICALFIPN